MMNVVSRIVRRTGAAIVLSSLLGTLLPPFPGAIADVGSDDIAVYVSHGVTINAFIGVYLSQGEMVVVRPAKGGGDDAGVDETGRH